MAVIFEILRVIVTTISVIPRRKVHFLRGIVVIMTRISVFLWGKSASLVHKSVLGR